jgi:predicted deacylase
VLYDERPHDPANSISYPNTAQTRGKPALTLEVGQLGQLRQHDVDAIEQSTLKAMRYLGMYDAPKAVAPKEMDKEAKLYRKLVGVQSPSTGIFKPLTQVGDDVKQGQAIGQISDYFGHAMTTLYAPISGTVLIQTETPAIRKGESAVEIALPR